MIELGGAGVHRASEIGSTVLHLGAFVAVVGVAGLILVPWLLKRMSISMDEELQTLGLAALLFGLAILAQKAGYSVALGAFLLGIIVGETPHRHQVERTFEGMRDVFSAVFFVAIGMQIDPHELLASAGLIAGVTVFTLLARPIAVALGLGLAGVPPRDGVRAGLMAAPIGEFSFVIAQLGVGAGVVTGRLYPLVVGVSLLTTLVTPFVARRSDAVATVVLGRQPGWLRDWLGYYQDWLDRFMRQRQKNTLWQLSRKRFAQIGIEMLFVSGVLVFSGELYAGIVSWLGPDWIVPRGAVVLLGPSDDRRHPALGRHLAELLGPGPALRPGLDRRPTEGEAAGVDRGDGPEAPCGGPDHGLADRRRPGRGHGTLASRGQRRGRRRRRPAPAPQAHLLALPARGGA